VLKIQHNEETTRKMAKNKLAENWIIVCIITSFITWGVRDLMGTRSMMYTNFVSEKRFVEFKDDLKDRMNKLDSKIDRILMNFPKESDK